MSYQKTSKSTKRRRYLEELEIMELSDHSVTEINIQPSVLSSSSSDNNTFINTNNELSSSSSSNQIINFSEFNECLNIFNDEYDAISLQSNSEFEDELNINENNSKNDDCNSIINGLAN